MIVDLSSASSLPQLDVAVELRRANDTGTAGAGKPLLPFTGATAILALTAVQLARPVDGTAIAAELAAAQPDHDHAPEAEPPAPPNNIEKTRDDRLALLARRYVAGVQSREEDARYRILTERLRALDPRITFDDWDRVTRQMERGAEIDRQLADIDRRLGL